MPRYQSSHRKELPKSSPKANADALRSRPFAPVLQRQDQTPASPAHESQPAEFSVLEPGGSCPQPIQAKLTIGAPGDKYEQEADRVAVQMVQHINSPTANQPQADQVQRMELTEEGELQMKPDFLQREVEPDEEDELQMKPLLQRQGSGAVAASDDLDFAIQQSRGSGQPLADSIREPMEQAFGGVDFSGVKVHTDGRSDQLNRSIQAKAFTTGQDIFFRQGEYTPGSSGGQELIAHELTHVVQQNGKAVQPMMLMPGLNQVIQARKLTNDADLIQDVEDAQKKVDGAEHLTVLAVLQTIAGYFETDVSGATKASEAFTILSNDTNRIMDTEDREVIAQIVQNRMRAVAKDALRREKAYLYEVMPESLYDHKQLQGKTKWNSEMDNYLKAEIDVLCGTSWHIDQASVTEEIVARREQRQTEWLNHAWKKVGELKPIDKSSIPVKTKFWEFLGWKIQGLEWKMKTVEAGPTGTKLHLTVSGDSMLAPSTLVNEDANILNKSPDLIYSKLFESVTVSKRVHVTRESTPKKHLYIGDTNGEGVAIKDDAWEDDAKTMKEHLNSFRTDVIQKIIAAKLKRWDLK
ncbi:DUF4157 domain-containing protein [Nodosilinea sp. E11]|uniref:eCIS core domain-containing protein n=1 Tax=Nodosilinea sp. E11 TaxID=3037479 RepID=UPI0029350F88|nr:DUF4157 domain-containing protein [Nodosilinea sp. E11]WOD37087.1 DUF4157 domain-containing protein [Nodosilinea sp. E11]